MTTRKNYKIYDDLQKSKKENKVTDRGKGLGVTVIANIK